MQKENLTIHTYDQTAKKKKKNPRKRRNNFNIIKDIIQNSQPTLYTMKGEKCFL